MKRLLIIFNVIFLIFIIFSVSVSAVFYDSDYPDQFGLTGGPFIKGKLNNGSFCYILLPADKADCFSVDTAGIPVNISSGTINATYYYNNAAKSCRFSSFGTLQVRNDIGYTSTWDDVDIQLVDTNIDFITDSDYYNSNFHFSKFEISILSLCICILFFEVLNWWLLHKI